VKTSSTSTDGKAHSSAGIISSIREFLRNASFRKLYFAKTSSLHRSFRARSTRKRQSSLRAPHGYRFRRLVDSSSSLSLVSLSVVSFRSARSELKAPRHQLLISSLKDDDEKRRLTFSRQSFILLVLPRQSLFPPTTAMKLAAQDDCDKEKNGKEEDEAEEECFVAFDCRG